MSTFKVTICEVSDVIKHPGAEKLDIIRFRGMDWQCVTVRGNFQVGDPAVYFPIDSILPPEIESKIFGIDAKVKLTNSRVKTIKLRGAISQGLAVTPATVLGANIRDIGDDVTKLLGVTKYEPVEKGPSITLGKATHFNTNPNFRKYTSIENAKNYPNIFTEGEEVVVTCKLHGTNFRAGYVEYHADTIWKKIKKKLGLAPKHEFVYGSHHRQLQSKLLYKGFYDTNVYAEAVVKYQLKQLLKPGEVVFGEIIGDGIQKGYLYGCRKGERKLVLFDVMVNGKYLDVIEAKKFVQARNLDFVPILYTGPFNKEKILSFRDGPSVYAPSQPVREGIVVKPIKETASYIGRKMVKYISDEYLLRNQDNESIAH